MAHPLKKHKGVTISHPPQTTLRLYFFFLVFGAAFLVAFFIGML